MFERPEIAASDSTIVCCRRLDGARVVVSGSSGAVHLGIGRKGTIYSPESFKSM